MICNVAAFAMRVDPAITGERFRKNGLSPVEPDVHHGRRHFLQ